MDDSRHVWSERSALLCEDEIFQGFQELPMLTFSEAEERKARYSRELFKECISPPGALRARTVYLRKNRSFWRSWHSPSMQAEFSLARWSDTSKYAWVSEDSETEVHLIDRRKPVFPWKFVHFKNGIAHVVPGIPRSESPIVSTSARRPARLRAWLLRAFRLEFLTQPLPQATTLRR